MLEQLKFVQGAVAKKDFVPELTHFRIQDGQIRGYNGMIALGCPIDLQLNVRPKAVPFVKAIQTCTETIAMHQTKSGRLSVTSGNFKCFVDCSEEEWPDVLPEGRTIELPGSFMDGLRAVAPFIAEDASRPWARGVLFRDESVFATNNVILAEAWTGYRFPVELNVPRAAIVELLRIGTDPTSIQVAERNVTFHFPEGKWLRTQVYDLGWPDVSTILAKPSTQAPVPEGFWEAVDSLTPFLDELNRVWLTPGTMSTAATEGLGATIVVPGIVSQGLFNQTHLRKLSGVVQTIDLSAWPKPCLFFGDRIRGAIVGLRP